VRTWLLNVVRCPFCSARLEITKTLAERDGEIQYAVLACADCEFDYPVVAGIPILRRPSARIDANAETRDDVTFEGPRVSDVVRPLLAGDPIDALQLLLNPLSFAAPLRPGAVFDGWHSRVDPDGIVLGGADPPAEPAHPPVGGLKGALRRLPFIVGLKRSMQLRMLPAMRRELALRLEGAWREASAVDILAFYYDTYSRDEMATYFTYRYAQPRHLAGLCLASLARGRGGRVLDVAAGAGHWSHYFSYGAEGVPTCGLDRDFFRAFVAKRYVAPLAEIVCAEADMPLPFDSGAFESVFCSDALAYFPHRALAVREFARVCTPEGLVLLPRTRNGRVVPKEGFDLPVSGYRRLLQGFETAIASEGYLVDGYLRREWDLTGDRATDLDAEGWVYIAASRRGSSFAGSSAGKPWPHEVGRLGINPLYARVGESAEGDVSLKRRVPSAWYEHQNGAQRLYMPDTCQVPRRVIDSLRAGARPFAVEPLVDRFVVIGMPDRYVFGGAAADA
jgi:SAM-dependent methyltransferase/uncharacterized protein YbaR (Trm112 family)